MRDEIEKEINRLRPISSLFIENSSSWLQNESAIKTLQWVLELMGKNHIEKIGPTWIHGTDRDWHGIARKLINKSDELVDAVNELKKRVG